MSEELKQLITWFENYQVTFNEIRLNQFSDNNRYSIQIVTF